MKLISCHIDRFGKLENLDYDFKEGLNTILQENGWGKTTFSNFLFAMFYGVGANNSKALLRRDKYAPWNGGNYGGSIRFSLGGKNYTLFRSFGTNEKSDTFLLQNTDGNAVSSDYSVNIGEEIFGINGETFLRTAFVRQGNVDFESTSEMNSKISASDGGALGLELFSDTLKKLEDRGRELYSPKVTAGLIRPLEQKIVEDKAEAIQLKNETIVCPELEKTLAELKKAIDEKEEEGKLLQKKAFQLNEGEKRKQLSKLLLELQEARKDLEDEPLFGKNFVKAVCDLAIQKQSVTGRKKEEKASLENKQGNLKIQKAEIKNQLSELQNQEEIKIEEEKRREKEEKEKKLQSIKKKNIENILILVVGILIMGFGIYEMITGAMGIGVGICILSLVLIMIGLILKLKTGKKKRAFDAEIRLEESELNSRMESLNSANVSKNSERIVETLEIRNLKDTISKLEEDIQNCGGEIEKVSQDIENLEKEMDDYLESFGRKGEPENRFSALTKLQEDGLSLEDKKEDLKKAENRISEFKAENPEIYEKVTAESEAAINGATTLTTAESPEEPAEESTEEQETTETLKKKTERNEAELRELREEKIRKEKSFDWLLEKTDELREMEEKLLREEEELAEYELEYTRIQKAIEHLKKANDTLSNTYQGPIQRGLEKYYEKLNGTKDRNIQVDKDMKVQFVEGAKLMAPEKLNAGHQDLLNLSVRMSILDSMYKEEKPFLIFDDVFTNMDDQRLRFGKELLREISENYQVIYFTCHPARS